MCVGQRCWPSRQFHLTICRWIQQHTNLFLHQFHNKNGTYLSRIAKGGSSIKATQSMLIPNRLRRLREYSVGFSFNVALHACLHSVKGMGQVACKQSTQKSCWNSCLSSENSLGIPFAFQLQWNGPRPRRFSHRTTNPSSTNVGRVFHNVRQRLKHRRPFFRYHDSRGSSILRHPSSQ